jgi:hypothetical protein
MLAILERKASGEPRCSVGCAVAGLIIAVVLALLSIARVLDWDCPGILLLGVYAAVIAVIIGVVRELIVRADIWRGVYRRIVGSMTCEAHEGGEGSVTYCYRADGQSFPLS